MTLNNLTAIVTGGCSGLGHATAIALRNAGANVSLFDLNEELGAQRVEELGKNNTLFTRTIATRFLPGISFQSNVAG